MTQLNPTQIRDGVAWATNKQPNSLEPGTSPWIWFWEAIQGDFNEERTTSQIMTDAALSMIPGVDQICDLRDLVANCKKLKSDVTDAWAWVALALTLIGLFPSLGSLVKGVLKIFFLFIRHSGGDAVAKAVDEAMTWVVTFLRRREVQKYLGGLDIDEVFTWLANQVRAVRGRLSVKELLNAFDSGIRVLEPLVNKVALFPRVGSIAKSALNDVKSIRAHADRGLNKALGPVNDVLKHIILAMEKRIVHQRHAILDTANVHYRTTLTEAAALTLMRTSRPQPKWLSSGRAGTWAAADPDDYIRTLNESVNAGWPKLSSQNIESFHSLVAAEIKGPARLYRIISPNSRAMSDCWISEEVFKRLQNAPDPRAAWRKHLAVWPDWNANGQFVMYDIKPGETLKVWRGPASSQTRSTLPDSHLEGGWEQIVFNIDRASAANDTMRYYKLSGPNGDRLDDYLDQSQFDRLSREEKSGYMSVRERINHPNIGGPYETGWGYTDFGGAGLPARVGLPALPGQLTNSRME